MTQRSLNLLANWDESSFWWLVGLLEAEGSFMKPPPSGSKGGIIKIEMTDEDTVTKVSKIFLTKHHRINPRQAHHKASFTCTIKGVRAREIMRIMQPFMSERRKRQISEVLATPAPDMCRKLTLQQANNIRSQYRQGGITHNELGIQYGLSRRMIGNIITGDIYQSIVWKHNLENYNFNKGFRTQIAVNAWLAGFIEGEGFIGSPKKTSTIVVEVSSNDLDIIQRFNDYVNGSSIYTREPPLHEKKWGINYSTTVKGQKAIVLLETIYPLLSQRRQEKIISSLATLVEGYENKQFNWKSDRKLTFDQVTIIRQEWLQGYSLTWLSQKYNLDRKAIYNIIQYNTYKTENYEKNIRTSLFVQESIKFLETIKSMG